MGVYLYSVGANGVYDEGSITAAIRMPDLDWPFCGTGFAILLVALLGSRSWRSRTIDRRRLATAIVVVAWVALVVWLLYFVLVLVLSLSDIELN